jgi:acetoin utilization deacetylase AcuC-like enzyme
MVSIAYLSHPACLAHDVGEFHPECPARLYAIEDDLSQSQIASRIKYIKAPKVDMAHLIRVHDQEYIDSLFECSPQSGCIALDQDTLMMSHTLVAALHAAGAVVEAVDLVMNADFIRAFCGVRPPGHHAKRAQAMGFCYFNNIAVGVAYACSQYDLKRVAIVDFDVHHGNGTEDIFKSDPRVLLCSSFQHPFYPFTGANTTVENILNMPLIANTNGTLWRAKIEQQWLPKLSNFAPQLIFVSAGFDAHWEDDMSQINLVEDDYQWLTQRLVALASRHCQGRIISVLEGGYALKALGRSVLVHLNSLLRDQY